MSDLPATQEVSHSCEPQADTAPSVAPQDAAADVFVDASTSAADEFSSANPETPLCMADAGGAITVRELLADPAEKDKAA